MIETNTTMICIFGLLLLATIFRTTTTTPVPEQSLDELEKELMQKIDRVERQLMQAQKELDDDDYDDHRKNVFAVSNDRRLLEAALAVVTICAILAIAITAAACSKTKKQNESEVQPDKTSIGNGAKNKGSGSEESDKDKSKQTQDMKIRMSETKNLRIGETENKIMGETDNRTMGGTDDETMGKTDNEKMKDTGNVTFGETGNVTFGETGNLKGGQTGNLRMGDTSNRKSKETTTIIIPEEVVALGGRMPTSKKSVDTVGLGGKGASCLSLSRKKSRATGTSLSQLSTGRSRSEMRKLIKRELEDDTTDAAGHYNDDDTDAEPEGASGASL